jgi:hypothetical protein
VGWIDDGIGGGSWLLQRSGGVYLMHIDFLAFDL